MEVSDDLVAWDVNRIGLSLVILISRSFETSDPFLIRSSDLDRCSTDPTIVIQKNVLLHIFGYDIPDLPDFSRV